MSNDFLGPMGWIPPQGRTAAMDAAHADAVATFFQFHVQGKTDESAEKVDLTDIWADPRVAQALGFAFPGVHQYTGSCVGAAGGNCFFTLAAIEVIRLGDPEEIIVPFWLLPYGRSRHRAGMRGRGEGSLGSTFAEAARDDGILPTNLSDLPAFKVDDGLSWYKEAELSWSDGGARQTLDRLAESRKYLVKSTADCRSADDVEQAVRNGYPVTTASVLIPSPRVEDDGEAYGRVSRQGGHQTCYLGVWRHPRKGKRFFKYVNQWGLRWGKQGACWVPEEDVEAAIRDGRETYAFSQFNGFPSQKLDWLI